MPFVLDAYAARSCALKTANAFNPALTRPEVDRPVPLFFHDADAIESDVVARLQASGVSLVDLRPLRGEPSDVQEAAALAALRDGTEVVVAPLLPRDWEGHRSGRPTLLVRAPDGRGYRPVIVKFHRVLESAAPDTPGVPVSSLSSVRQEVTLPQRQFRWGTRLRAALQVAHHWRLLETTGFAAEHPRGGLIGLDQLTLVRSPEIVVTWLDLNDPVVPPNPRDLELPAQAPSISTLERYDREHAFRVRLAEAAQAASGTEPLLTPIVSPECRHCAWQSYCHGHLDSDDLSLRISKTPLDIHEVRTLRRLGIVTISDLADADLESLLLDYLPRVSHRDGGEDRLRKAHHRARLLNAGVEVERVGNDPIELPRHALEIDIDIETSADDRVYLWGFWIDDGGEGHYREFSRFADLDAAAEAELACEAFAWLQRVTQGQDAAVYHYSEYETVRINRLAPRCPAALGDWVRGFASDHFVDLFEVVKRHFFGVNGLGLKAVAGAVTGFTWRDEEPGGLNSQRWFQDAVHGATPALRDEARTRVLEYNEDDVRATWHLRQWLRSQI